MAVSTASSVWVFMLLTVAANGFPAKKALDPRRAYNSSPPFGSSQGMTASGFARAESGSTAPSDPALKPAVHEHPRYLQSSAQSEQVPGYYSSSGSVVPSQFTYSSTPRGSAESRFQAFPTQDDLCGTAKGAACDPQRPKLTLQPGELSYVEMTDDQGVYDLEAVERLSPTAYMPVLPMNRLPISSILPFGPYLDGFGFGHPYANNMMFNRLYPPGTYTFSTSGLEHGRNHWHDTLSVRDPSTRSSSQPSQSYPQSESLKQPLQQAWSVENTGYDEVTG